MSRGPWERCQLTHQPMRRLDGLGPAWVDDNGLRPERVPNGLTAMPVSSASAIAGYSNQTVGTKALREDSRWHPYELWSTSSPTAAVVQRGIDQPPRGGSFSGVIFDSPGSLSWLGDRQHEEARARMLAGNKAT